MTALYLSMLLCYALMPLSLISGQWLLVPALAVIVLLLRGQMVMRTQLDYLLLQDSVRQMANTLKKRDASLPQVKPVKGL